MAAREPCWFPGLADEVVTAFWAKPQRIDRLRYSTARWLGDEPDPGHRALTVPGHPTIAFEPLPAAFVSRFGSQEPGHKPAEIAPVTGEALACLLHNGAGMAVVRLIRSIHCIRALGPGYDCSHSEPAIPFSVFLSVPLGERHARLRLAESLLHEAMHLQLSLVELQAPIVGSEPDYAYSPWQQSIRPVHGLLHGLYVFTAIHQWLTELLSDPTTSDEVRIYAERRQFEIAKEVAAVTHLPRSGTLTTFGRMLAAGLLDRVPPPAAVR